MADWRARMTAQFSNPHVSLPEASSTVELPRACYWTHMVLSSGTNLLATRLTWGRLRSIAVDVLTGLMRPLRSFGKWHFETAIAQLHKHGPKLRRVEWRSFLRLAGTHLSRTPQRLRSPRAATGWNRVHRPDRP